MRTYTIEKTNKDLFAALKKCCSYEVSRKFLTHINWDGKRLSATDGKRLMVIEDAFVTHVLGEEPGTFDLKGDMLVEVGDKDGKFPEIERVIPKDDLMERFHIPSMKITKKFKDSLLCSCVNIWRNETTTFISPELFDGIGCSGIEWKSIGGRKDDYSSYPVRLDGVSGAANVKVVLMPSMVHDEQIMRRA